MTPIKQSHYDYITSEVIPMTDEQRAADHADISVRFAIEILRQILCVVEEPTTKYKDIAVVLYLEIGQLEKTLNKGIAYNIKGS